MLRSTTNHRNCSKIIRLIHVSVAYFAGANCFVCVAYAIYIIDIVVDYPKHQLRLHQQMKCPNQIIVVFICLHQSLCGLLVYFILLLQTLGCVSVESSKIFLSITNSSNFSIYYSIVYIHGVVFVIRNVVGSDVFIFAYKAFVVSISWVCSHLI